MSYDVTLVAARGTESQYVTRFLAFAEETLCLFQFRINSETMNIIDIL
jgi:hypothetical protein